jgi:hypothetical protein
MVDQLQFVIFFFFRYDRCWKETAPLKSNSKMHKIYNDLAAYS